MSSMYRWSLVFLAVLILGTTAVAAWSVIDSGGGYRQSANVVVHDALGQPVSGWSDTGSVAVHSGFIQPFSDPSAPQYRIYLPTVLR